MVNTEIELADFNLAQLKKQSLFQDQIRAAHPIGLEGEEAFLKNEADASARRLFIQDKRAGIESQAIGIAGELIPLQSEIARKRFEEFELGGKASDTTLAIIRDLAEGQRAAGGEALDTSIEDVMAQINAGAGGNIDPELFRKTRAEGARQGEQFQRGVDAFETRSELNFPLESAGLTDNRSANLSNLGSLSGQFNSELQSQANANRTQLTSSVGGLGLSLATGVNANPGALAIEQMQTELLGPGPQQQPPAEMPRVSLAVLVPVLADLAHLTQLVLLARRQEQQARQARQAQQEY